MSETGGWRYIHASVPGVAHRACDGECQDAYAVRLLTTLDRGPVLLLTVADGAGSANQSRAGAEQACQTLLTALEEQLSQDLPLQDWTRAEGKALLQQVQAVLAQQAAAAVAPVREFACTLLGAVIATDYALFLQLGDGAIVIGTEGHYRPVFWPQTGEYANETYFVTDPNAADRLEFTTLPEPITEIALLTDGLQMLALHYQSRQAHAPFFQPLFQRLRDYPEDGCPAALVTALERFLDGPAVNQRTHDDKTLILATRILALHDTAQPVATEAMPASMQAEIATAIADPTAIAIQEPSAVDSIVSIELTSADNPEVCHADVTPADPIPTASTPTT
ncbi:MAG: PP2C family serine/threonine-protein phosphatase [Candidatus Competibacteraceae bacterium]